MTLSIIAQKDNVIFTGNKKAIFEHTTEIVRKTLRVPHCPTIVEPHRRSLSTSLHLSIPTEKENEIQVACKPSSSSSSTISPRKSPRIRILRQPNNNITCIKRPCEQQMSLAHDLVQSKRPCERKTSFVPACASPRTRLNHRKSTLFYSTNSSN